jgi:hypothetical protein
MSSFTTTPAFIHYGTWDDITRAHPAMKWLEDFVRAWDSREWYTDDSALFKWITPDFVLKKADGSSTSGAEKGFAALKASYGPLISHLHIPYYLVVTKTRDGWKSCVKRKYMRTCRANLHKGK